MSLKRIYIAAAALAFSMPAAAEENWEYIGTLYGWFPGHETSVDTPFGEFETEVEFSEILENLDFAAFGAFEARKGRWAFVVDGMYVDLSSEVKTPFGTLFKEGEIESQGALVSAYATYAPVMTKDLRLDIGGGVRYANVSIDSSLKGQGGVPNVSYSDDGSWADLLLAARVKYFFSGDWFTVAYADVGGFGIGESSDLTWQGSIGLGYRINESVSTRSGFRYLSIEREFDRADISTDVSGPFLGVQVTF